MEWTRSETLALAMHNCAQCHGSGLRLARKGTLSPCNCVMRAIFRICSACSAPRASSGWPSRRHERAGT